MSRTVFCRKYQKDLPGLDKAPFPGPKGQAIYEGVSALAWQEWTKNQTMLINEHQLNVRDRQARQFLAEEQEKFLKNEEYATAAGYKPEAE